MVLAVACFGIGQWRTLGSSNVGLAFSQSIQMLVSHKASSTQHCIFKER